MPLPLVLLAVACDPAAPAALLAEAAHLAGDDSRVCAALLGHANLADQDAAQLRVEDPDAVPDGLRRAAPERLGRFLAACTTLALSDHLDRAGSLEVLPPEPHIVDEVASRFHDHPGVDWPALAVLVHPDATRSALTTALDHQLDGSRWTSYRSARRELLITRATSVPDRLAYWAARAPRDVAAELSAYARVHASGADAYRTRVDDVLAEVLPGDPLSWGRAVSNTGDERVAAAALAAVPPGRGEPLAAMGVSSDAWALLRHTSVGRARLAWRSGVDPRSCTTPEAFRVAAAASDSWEVAGQSSRWPAQSDAADVEVAMGPVDRAASMAPGTEGHASGYRGAHLVRIVLHPAVTPSQLARVHAHVARYPLPVQGVDEMIRPTFAALADLVGAPHPHRWVWEQPLPTVSWLGRGTVADRVGPMVVAATGGDPAVLRAAVHLEPHFSGSVAQLMATAAAVVAG